MFDNLKECASVAGIDVYLASAGHYGFITNGNRVVSFQTERGRGLNISGNYVASHQSGTGWQIVTDVDESTITEHDLRSWLCAIAPWWANKSPVYVTCAQHLAIYDKSSRYRKV